MEAPLRARSLGVGPEGRGGSGLLGGRWRSLDCPPRGVAHKCMQPSAEMRAASGPRECSQAPKCAQRVGQENAAERHSPGNNTRGGMPNAWRVAALSPLRAQRLLECVVAPTRLLRPLGSLECTTRQQRGTPAHKELKWITYSRDGTHYSSREKRSSPSMLSRTSSWHAGARHLLQ